MPVSFTIASDHGVILSSWVGVLSDAELITAYEGLLSNEAFEPGLHEVVDVRDAQMDAVTSEGLRRLAAMVAHHLAGRCERFKTAVIASSGLQYGLGRQYGVYSDESPEHTAVFRDPAGAFAWVGADESLLRGGLVRDVSD